MSELEQYAGYDALDTVLYPTPEQVKRELVKLTRNSVYGKY